VAVAAGIIAFHCIERMQMWGGDGDVKKGLICSSENYIFGLVESGHFSGYSPGFLDQKL
jgi:hypothetical protein